MSPFRSEGKEIVRHLLDDDEGPANPQAVADELGLTFRGEQDWFGVGKLWDFTMMDPASPYSSTTFYVRAGATRAEIINRWNEKRAAEDQAVGRVHEAMESQCMQCRRVFDTPTQTWVNREPSDPKNVTHGVCPLCKKAYMSQIEKLKAAQSPQAP